MTAILRLVGPEVAPGQGDSSAKERVQDRQIWRRHSPIGVFDKLSRVASPHQAKSQDQAFTTTPEELEAAKENEMRWTHIVGNDMENIPLGIILAWVSIVAGGNSTATSVLFLLFTVCLLVHTVAFVHGVFLPRTLAWQVGALSTLGLAITAVIGPF
ncbi:hypothetical protein AC1031_014828 [Aphanomyces cochlioides]|nr:hypothetical protein AC1031_014828 [Aphanomyces cochlioides]